MADGAEFSIDEKKLDRDADRLVRHYLGAGTTAVAATTRSLEQRLEGATKAAAPGRLWRAWQSEVYPRSGPARDPVGTVFVNGTHRTKGAMTFWTETGSARGRRGQYLAIPLPAAGKPVRNRGGEYQLTPAEWEQRTGMKLRFVVRAGRSPLLVADNSRLGGRNQLARRRGGKPMMGPRRDGATIPVFVLIPTITFRGTVAVAPLVNAAEGELVRNFLEAARAVA